MKNERYDAGDIVEIIDQIDHETLTTATIKLVEQDDDIPEIFWLYLVSNKEEDNTHFDSKIGYFWRLIANTEPYIRLVSKASM